MKITCVLLALLLVGLIVADACRPAKRQNEVDVTDASPNDSTRAPPPSRRPKPSDDSPRRPLPCGKHRHHSGDGDRPRPSDRPGSGGDSGSAGNEGGATARSRATTQAGPSETPRQEGTIV